MNFSRIKTAFVKKSQLPGSEIKPEVKKSSKTQKPSVLGSKVGFDESEIPKARLMANRSALKVSEQSKMPKGFEAIDCTLSDWLKQNKIKVKVEKLEEEEYETLQDIREIESQDLDEIIEALGLKKKSALAFKKAHAKLLRSGVAHEEKSEAQAALYRDEGKTSDTFELTSEFKDTILKLLNVEMPKNQIISTIAPEKGVKQDIVSKFIDNLIRKPKSPPEGCIRCGVRLPKGDVSLPLYVYPAEEIRGRKYHTFLVLGETGAGKTTLLDAFVNCLGNISYSDSWRWKLVNEDTMSKKVMGTSMTDKIKYYYVNDERSTDKPYHVRIIDTPGFGDSRGIQHDENIVKQFEKLFTEELEELDYILLVVKGTMTRWTPPARYVYDRVQQVFGKDARDRFILMCTFADGATPNVLSVLENKLHWEEVFTFNNSALYTPAGTTWSKKNNTKFFWDMAMKSVTEFLDFASGEARPPLSLTNSREVMETRAHIQVSINTAQSKINEMLGRLETLNTTMDLIDRNREMINRIGKVTIMVPETYFERSPLDHTYQMCERCQVTCCQICKWPANEPLSVCTYFNGNSNCPCCPGKCPKNTHIRSRELIEKKTRQVERVLEEKAREKKEGEENLSFAQRELNKIHDEMQAMGKEILDCMQLVKDNMNKLEEIALKPRIFTTAEYFSQMIKHEENTKNPGWKGRVEGIKIMKKRAEGMGVLRKLEKEDDLRQLYPQYSDLIEKATKEKGQVGKNCIIM